MERRFKKNWNFLGGVVRANRLLSEEFCLEGKFSLFFFIAMKGALVFACLALLVCGAFASWPSMWTPEERLSGSSRVSFTMSLKRRNLEEFNALFERITTPGSPEYGQYRTISELTDMIAPPLFEQNFVLHYLEARGCEATSYGDVIIAEGPSSAVEEIFGVEMHNFRHNSIADVVLQRSTVFPTIPTALSHIVEFVTGLSTFPADRSNLAKNKIPLKESVVAEDDKWVVPQTIRNLYNVPENPSGLKSNSMAVVEFGIVAGVSQDDLTEFMQLTGGPSNASLAYTVGTFAFTPISPIDGESTLDVQYILAVAPNVPCSFWTINGWMYDFTTLVQQRQAQGKPVPLVFSMSYGWAEADQCDITGNGESCNQVSSSGNSGYINAVNVNFQKIGASGVTLLAASGDAGAATKENIDCTDKQTPIQPDFPASSPYLTAVGGTMLQNGGTALTGNLPPFCTEPGVTCAGGGVEIVSIVPEALITSGGGFSNVFAQPSYQTAAVNSWMNSGALQPPTSEWNQAGRGYPDVAGLAHKYMIVENGEKFSVDGTSASCPVTAGIVALINDQRLRNNQSPVGFINPALYQMSASAFNDITYSNNTGTEMHGAAGQSFCYTDGYGASSGWDPTVSITFLPLWIIIYLFIYILLISPSRLDSVLLTTLHGIPISNQTTKYISTINLYQFQIPILIILY